MRIEKKDIKKFRVTMWAGVQLGNEWGWYRAVPMDRGDCIELQIRQKSDRLKTFNLRYRSVDRVDGSILFFVVERTLASRVYCLRVSKDVEKEILNQIDDVMQVRGEDRIEQAIEERYEREG